MTASIIHRRVLLLGAALAPAAAGAGSWSFGGTTRGSGKITREVRVVEPFDTLRVSGASKLELRQGEREGIEVETDDNIQPLIETMHRGSTLEIGQRGNIKPTSLSIVITARRIDVLEVSGAAGLVAPGRWRAEKMRLEVGGAGVLKFADLAVEHLGVEGGGSGVLNLGGSAGVLRGALGGASTLSAKRLSAREADLRVGGSAQAVLWVRESLQGSVGGAGALRYYGKPRADVSRGGAGKVAALGLTPPP
jgi:hypothetical protein